jgi:hypothetical protein
MAQVTHTCQQALCGCFRSLGTTVQTLRHQVLITHTVRLDRYFKLNTQHKHHLLLSLASHCLPLSAVFAPTDMGMQAYLNSINATIPAIDNSTLYRLIAFHILPGTAYFPLTTVRGDDMLSATWKRATSLSQGSDVALDGQLLLPAAPLLVGSS